MVDKAHPQAVGVGVLLALGDIADDERGELGRTVLDALELEAERVQRIGDLAQRRLGVQMVLQPGQRELHGVSPRTRLGASSGTKP